MNKYEEVNEETPNFETTAPVLVETGLKSWEGATELEIFYYEGNTYVVTNGEFENCEPYWTKGMIPIEEVLKDYLEEIEEK